MPTTQARDPVMRQSYPVTGMTCEGCAIKVANALDQVEGVLDVVVDVQANRADVAMAYHVSTEMLRDAVEAVGFGLEDPQQAQPVLDHEDGTPGEPTPHRALPEYAATPNVHGTDNSDDTQGHDHSKESLYPLLLIVGFLLGVTLLIQTQARDASLYTWMRHFMAGFFIVFSFFKLLDIRGFVTAFRGYDLVAGKSQDYAWAYPFIELALGVAYLVDFVPVLTNLVTLTVMGVGAVGVLKALLDKKRIRCACLGTALNLPMTKVTLVEDVTMAGMALVMLVMVMF